LKKLGRNVVALSVVSFLTDVSSELIYPLLPLFLSGTLGVSASVIGTIEGAAESTASLLKLASGWWSDRLSRRKPLVVAGYALASVARPLVAIAQSATHVLAIRLTDRVGKGIRTAPRDALIADSVDASMRGRAFGIHRAADHAGAVAGPLIAFLLLGALHVPIRTVFWIAAIPGVLSVIVLMAGVREVSSRSVSNELTQNVERRTQKSPEGRAPLGSTFWKYLFVVLLFTLGNSTDAFLLLRATDLGVPVALVPILWAMLHVVKSASSGPGGALSDRVGRRLPIAAGWFLFAAVYFAFGSATAAWHVWVLFAVYGIFFGLTEGAEKALVSDLVPAARRGAAFGWYHLTIGLAALPASLIFGLIWDRAGAPSAFAFGASLALLAAIGILVVVPRRVGPRAI
jgi:MFS family permease